VLDFIFVFFIAFILAYLGFLLFIELLRRFKIGQKIRSEAPQRHQGKSGTPSFGGIVLLLVITILAVILIDIDLEPNMLAILGLFLGFALIGLTDDLLKTLRNQNQGLWGWQKLSLQIILAGLFMLFLIQTGHYNLSHWFLKIITLNSYIFYFLFSIFLIVGFSNAVNLTDGLDGLAGGTLIIAFAAFAYLASKIGNESVVMLLIITIAALCAFLKFNFYPAKIFMGDVGSLSFGALLCGAAILLHRELMLIIIGGIFVLEALSVIIQVGSYKLFKRRVFKMSPLHHHFELMGASERLVVFGFWVVGMLFAIAGIWIKT
jgi:phospho-N-acetylmuramoyl-pentapeptide-transferase